MAGVSRHGVRLTKVEPGELVVVIGLGMIGQMSAQAARRAGARVIAADLIPLRVEMAQKHSADRVVDARTESLEDVVREEAPDGADVVTDTTGDHRIFDRCLGLIHREGRITLQGYYPDPISVDFHPTHLQRPTVTFPCGWDDEFNDELAEDMATGRHRRSSRSSRIGSDTGTPRRRTSWWSSTPNVRSPWCWNGARPRRSKPGARLAGRTESGPRGRT